MSRLSVKAERRFLLAAEGHGNGLDGLLKVFLLSVSRAFITEP